MPLGDYFASADETTNAEQNVSPAFSAIAAPMTQPMVNPVQAPAAVMPVTDPSMGGIGAPWQNNILGLIPLAGLAGAAASRGDYNFAPNFIAQQQRLNLAQQEMALRNKQQAISTANTLADIMHAAPGYRKDLITAYARAAGMDPKDPNLQEIAGLASKMDTQDAQGLAEALRMLGVRVDNPGQLFSALKDPALRVQFFKQLEAQKQQETIDSIIQKYPETPPPGSNNVTPQGTPLPGNEGQIPPTTAQARLQYLNKEQQRLGQMYAAVSKAAPGSQMAKDINVAIDNIRAEIGQIQGQLNTEVTQAATQTQRDISNQIALGNQALREQGMAFTQALASLNTPAARAQARREEQQNAPLDVNATRWIHPDSLETASPDMSPAEAKAGGYSVVTSSLSQAVPSARTALKALDRFKQLSDKLLVSTEGMNSAQAIAAIRANQVKLKALEMAGNPDVQEFIALGATLPSQVKAFGDTGNIAVKETEFAGRSLPNFGTDSKESAQRKVASRIALLKQVLRSSISTASRRVQSGVTEPATGKENDPLGIR